jgi:formamidopyrimidine-DNA glycosylase
MEEGERFFIHLGMTGRLVLVAAGTPLLPHTHVIFHIDGREMRFVDPRRFGGVFWLGAKDPGEELGPEPLEMTADELTQRLAKTRRAIKTALLDQRVLAGVGNIYADEALFHAGIDPRLAANRLSTQQIVRLNESIKTVLNRAIEHKGSTLRDYRDGNGEPGNFQKVHQVYDREGQPCLVCGGPIKRIVLGGRSTHFCPHCQQRRHKRPAEPATRGRRIQ